jgi:hypothetical protein
MEGSVIPTFRNDAEAAAYAERHQPYAGAQGPLSEDYAALYGARAWAAAQGCRDAFAQRNTRSLHVHARALALILFADHPQLFELRKSPPPRAYAHRGGGGRSSACDAKAGGGESKCKPKKT